MHFYHHPALDLDLSKYGFDIPLLKSRFDKVRQYLLNKYPGDSSLIDLNNLEPYSEMELKEVHDEKFIFLLKNEPKKFVELAYEGELHSDNHMGEQLLNEMLLHSKATEWVMKKTLQQGNSFFIGGGMHHSMSFTPRGFCPVSDIVLGINSLLKAEKIESAWVIDVDAHKGDGTAQITQDDERIITLSIHMEKGWPLDSDVCPESFIPSNVDIPIGLGEENIYIKKLEEGLNYLKLNYALPDIAVVVQGADPFEGDQLESAELLKLSMNQMGERDQLVYSFFKNNSVPQCYLMAGGYGDKAHLPTIQFIDSVLGS